MGKLRRKQIGEAAAAGASSEPQRGWQHGRSKNAPVAASDDTDGDSDEPGAPPPATTHGRSSTRGGRGRGRGAGHGRTSSTASLDANAGPAAAGKRTRQQRSEFADADGTLQPTFTQLDRVAAQAAVKGAQRRTRQQAARDADKLDVDVDVQAPDGAEELLLGFCAQVREAEKELAEEQRAHTRYVATAAEQMNMGADTNMSPDELPQLGDAAPAPALDSDSEASDGQDEVLFHGALSHHTKHEEVLP